MLRTQILGETFLLWVVGDNEQASEQSPSASALPATGFSCKPFSEAPPRKWTARGTLTIQQLGFYMGSNEGGPRTWLSDGLAGSSDIDSPEERESRTAFWQRSTNIIYHNQAFE